MEDFPFGLEKFLIVRSRKQHTCVDWVTDECYDYISSNQLYLGKENIDIIISANVDCAQVERNLEWVFNENKVKVCIIYGEFVNRLDYFSVHLLGKVFRLPGWVLLRSRSLDTVLFNLVHTTLGSQYNESEDFALSRYAELQSEKVFQVMCLYFLCAMITKDRIKFFKGIYSEPLILVCKTINKFTKKSENENEYTRFFQDVSEIRNELPLGKKSFKTLYRYIFWLYRNFYR